MFALSAGEESEKEVEEKEGRKDEEMGDWERRWRESGCWHQVNNHWILLVGHRIENLRFRMKSWSLVSCITCVSERVSAQKVISYFILYYSDKNGKRD